MRVCSYNNEGCILGLSSVAGTGTGGSQEVSHGSSRPARAPGGARLARRLHRFAQHRSEVGAACARARTAEVARRDAKVVGSHCGQGVECLAVRLPHSIRRVGEGGGVAGRATLSETSCHVLEQLRVRCRQVVLPHLALEGRDLRAVLDAQHHIQQQEQCGLPRTRSLPPHHAVGGGCRPSQLEPALCPPAQQGTVDVVELVNVHHLRDLAEQQPHAAQCGADAAEQVRQLPPAPPRHHLGGEQQRG